MISYLVNRFSIVKQLKGRLAETPLAYRLAKGAFWSLAGGIGLRALTFAVSIIVARTIGKEGYGELGIVQSTLGMFGTLAGFGLGTAATKYIAEYRLKDPAKADRIASFSMLFAFFCSGVMSVACALMSPWLASTTLNRSEIAPLLLAGALLLFISTMGGVFSAILAGFEAFKPIAKINIWYGITALLITYPLVYFYKVEGAIASLTISAAVSLILSAIATRKEYRKYNISSKFDKAAFQEWPVIWKYALPATIIGLLGAPVAWVTNAILVNQPGGYGEMGLFTAANQWRMAVIYLLPMLMSAMLPVMSETHGRSDKTDFKRIVSLNFRIAWLVALPITVIIISLGVPAAALFGKQYLDAAPIITILMISVFLHIINLSVASAIAGSGRIWIGTLMNLGWAVVMIISSLIFIPRLGGQGLAISYALSYTVHGICTMAYAERKIAKSSVSSQWQLMAYSIIVLLASMFISVRVANKHIYQVALIFLSLVPLFKNVRSAFSQRVMVNIGSER
ncbi:MAG: oligosaccharide flippase family protein [Nitrospirae bacterium]|nr:oligosaccharide flippase family protein [Nitrospirota bacterium]